MGTESAPTSTTGLELASNVRNRDLPHLCVVRMVNVTARETGSMMIAYECMARSIGTSSAWLRKFIRGYEAKEPGWSLGLAILQHYNRVCDRAELMNLAERQELLEIRNRVEAITTAIERMGKET